MGDPPALLGEAERMLGERIGVIQARSRDHWTRPWGFEDDRLFLNRALLVATGSPLEGILEQCLQIERELGRSRQFSQGYEARTLDIDILMQGNVIIGRPGLQVPHPRMHLRQFALAPAADIVPEWVHPMLGQSILRLLTDLRRQGYT